ncbi:hypothetical protein MRX96_018219 [Rhipicephalus microplus]
MMTSAAVGITEKENDKELSPLLADQSTCSGRAYGSRQERHSDDSDDAIRYFVRLDESRLGSRLKRTLVQIKRQSWCVPYLIGTFWFSALLAVPITFFPKVASEKGLPPWEFGLAFSVRKVFGMLAPAASLAMISYLSPKWGIVISQTVFGIQGILFGLSCLLMDKVVYLGVSFVGFIIMEFFMICMSICMETILASTLEQDGNLFLGAERSLSELGMMLGSVGAGALVDVSGDSVPYYVFGGALLAVTLLVVRSRHETRDSSNTQSSISDADGNPDPNEQNPARKTLWALLLNPCFMVDVFSRALCWVTAAFNYATLEPHIAQLQESNASIGVAFMVNYFASVIAYATMCSSYSRKFENFLIFVGSVLMATSYLIIGPAPFIPVETSFALICVSQALRGFGAGFIIICAYSNAMRVAVEDDKHPDDVRTRSFVCSTFSFFASIITIPLAPLSGFLVSIFGYRAASMWLFGLLSVWAFLTGSIWLVRGWQKDGKLIPPTDVDRQPYYQVHGRCTYPIIDSSQPLI